MFKYLFLFLSFTFFVFSQTIHFSEEKYFDSLEMTFSKKGKISFLKDKIEIIYDNDQTVLTYSNTVLTKQKGSDITTLDLQARPAIRMFFILFEAVYFDKKEILQLYFTMKTKDGVISLTPHKTIAAYIQSVQYQKKDKHLGFLKINLTNNDRILIEENY